MNDLLDYEQGLSNCCSAKVYADIGICADCKEPCDIVEEETI